MERKKMISRIPPIIGISFNKYFGKKQIPYPLAIKSPDFEYRLIGTIEHFGVLGSGHYISRFMRNGECYLADDATTKQISELNPVAETYMIFYELT
jgi:ubiquitin C-terminal hydrolase